MHLQANQHKASETQDCFLHNIQCTKHHTVTPTVKVGYIWCPKKVTILLKDWHTLAIFHWVQGTSWSGILQTCDQKI